MASTSVKREPLDDDAPDPVGLSGEPVIKLEPPDDTMESLCCDEGSNEEITYDSSDDDGDGDDFGNDGDDDDFGNDGDDDDDDGDYYYFFDDDDDEDGDDDYDDDSDDDGTEDDRPRKRARHTPPDVQSTSGGPSSGPRVYTAPSGHRWTSEVLKQEMPQVRAGIEPPGPRDVNPASTKLELWHLFLPPSVLHKVLRHTNEEGRRKRGGSWPNIVMMELMTVLGLLYFLGLTKSSQQNAKTFWRDGLFGRPVCQAAMMWKRFQSVMSLLHFEEKATREQRRATDMFAAIREVFDAFAASCRSFFTPGESITVGEQFVPFRGRCPFRQYVPESISAKYGIKFWLSVDSAHHFVTNIQPCLNQQGAKLGRRIILDLVEPVRQTGRNVTANSTFTTRELAEDLLAENLTLVGAIKANRREVPKELRPASVNKREAKSSVFAFDGPLTLLSYIPRKHFQVLLLSTMHHDDSVDPVSRKPELVDYYNQTKRGVDMVDQACSLYSVCRITKRWPLLVFFNLMNLAASNACVLWCALNPDWMQGASASNRHHAFLGELVMDLIHPQLQARAANPIGLHRNARLALSAMGYEVQYRRQALPGERAEDKRPMGRCHLCPRRDGRRTTKVCHTCRRFSCGLHSQKTYKVGCDFCLQ